MTRATPPTTQPADPKALAQWGIEGCAVGISIAGAATNGEWKASSRWVDRAEQRGLHSVWMPEMHFAPGANTSPLLCLSALASRTEKIRLATTSLLLPIHDPLRIAEEVSSLDHLSRGRVILGLGRGFRPALFSAFGIDPKEKRDRFDASLDLILSAWRGESVAPTAKPSARTRKVAKTQLRPPFQQPHPPLAVAAFGSKGLAQAARRGLPYLASPMEAFDQIRDNLQLHRKDMPDEQMPGHSVVPIMRTVFVSESDSVTQRVLMTLDTENRNIRGMRGPRTPKVIARAMEAPIEERVVVGQVAEVTDQLARYRTELGMNLMVIRPQVSGTEDSERLDALDRLIEEVMPALG